MEKGEMVNLEGKTAAARNGVKDDKISEAEMITTIRCSNHIPIPRNDRST